MHARALRRMGKFKKISLAIALFFLFIFHMLFLISAPTLFFTAFSKEVLLDVRSARAIANEKVIRKTQQYCGLDVSVKVNEVEVINWDKDGNTRKFYMLKQSVTYRMATYKVTSVVFSDQKLFTDVRHNVELFGVLQCREFQP